MRFAAVFDMSVVQLINGHNLVSALCNMSAARVQYCHSKAFLTFFRGEQHAKRLTGALCTLQVMTTTGNLTCEIPNANLHHFKGRFQFLSENPGVLLLSICLGFEPCILQEAADAHWHRHYVSPSATAIKRSHTCPRQFGGGGMQSRPCMTLQLFLYACSMASGLVLVLDMQLPANM